MPTKRPASLQRCNLYRLLEIDNFSDLEAIKRGFRNLALKYHPDRTPTDERAEQRFVLGTEAYRILRDADQKCAHDNQLKATLSGKLIYRENGAAGQGKKPVSALFVKRYIIDSERKYLVDVRREDLMQIVESKRKSINKSGIYDKRVLPEEELETLVREGRNHFKNYVDSLPKYKNGKS